MIFFGKTEMPGAGTMIKSAAKIANLFLYPAKCLNCGIYLDVESDEPVSVLAGCFCDTCLSGGPELLKEPFCTKCALKFNESGSADHVCESCLKHPMKLEQVRAVFVYSGIIAKAIPLLKYHSKLLLARVFEQAMFQAFMHYFDRSSIDIVMPVPLHRSRTFKRGFNQSFLMIRRFPELYHDAAGHRPLWKIDMKSLARIRKTSSQTGFDHEKRRQNLKNAFRVLKPHNIQGKNILLIDDVFTTGATCNEAAATLLNSGAGKISALVLARA